MATTAKKEMVRVPLKKIQDDILQGHWQQVINTGQTYEQAQVAAKTYAVGVSASQEVEVRAEDGKAVLYRPKITRKNSTNKKK